MIQKYQVRVDKILDESDREILVFGIDIPEMQMSIPNIFTTRTAADRFVRLCNRLDLSPIHIHDVIEDIL